MKKILFFLIAVIIVGSIALVSFIKGVDKVRDGLIANYPTLKNVVQGATTEFYDSLLTTTITKYDNAELYNLLKGDSKSDTLEITIPYYGRYGVDLSVRNFRVFRDEKTVEVWLPAIKLIYCELKFEKLVVNGNNAKASFKEENYSTLKNKMYETLLPQLEKNKQNLKAAKTTVAKSVMFYFIPYGFDLKLYIDNVQQTLPDVPGVNQTVDEAIHKMLGK